MDELPIGRRVAYWRGRRHMSQQVFADRLGKSKSWVDKVERGVRRLDKFSVVYDIADVLQLDAQLLLGKEPERRPGAVNCIDQVEVAEIRAALERYDAIGALFPQSSEPARVEDLRKAVDHAWLTFQHARYGMLARTLPRLLREAQAADNYYSGTEAAATAAHLLGELYQIASSALRKLGEYELAWLAADRSIAVSQRAGDQLLAGTATFRVGNALLALGRARPALEVNVNIANRLAPGSCAADLDEAKLSVYGMLLLQGTMAAARIGDSATVRDLLMGAEEAAARVGEDKNLYWTCFGPTNVKLHQAAAAVELGEGHAAAEIHESIDPEHFAVLMPERRAQHFIDLARGLAQTGEIERAGEMLLEGDRIAPAEVRCRPVSQEILANVLRRTRGTPSQALLDLAENMGVGI